MLHILAVHCNASNKQPWACYARQHSPLESRLEIGQADGAVIRIDGGARVGLLYGDGGGASGRGGGARRDVTEPGTAVPPPVRVRARACWEGGREEGGRERGREGGGREGGWNG